MKRGDIYYIDKRYTVGAEIAKSRPAVIVSNNALNATSGVVEVVYITTQPKRDMPTHVTINSSGVRSTALCEQIGHASVDLVGDYCGTCTPEEMRAIDAALLISLGIESERGPARGRQLTHADERLIEELERVKAERDRYAKMLDYFLGDSDGE